MVSMALMRHPRRSPDRDAELTRLVGEDCRNARAGSDDDADRQGFEHLVVALEGRGLGVTLPSRLEGDLRHVAMIGPACAMCSAPLGERHAVAPCLSIIAEVSARWLTKRGAP